MRWLIDGYNVMHAAGVIESKMNRQRFRHGRRRFLNDLADAFGDLAPETTVVFDANRPPADFPIESTYRGISLVFALADRDADARIERILAHHSHPKTLTIVSSDREVRRSATRRGAKAIKAEEFLDRMTTIAYEARPALQDSQDPEAFRGEPLPDGELAYWEEVFGDLALEDFSRPSPRADDSLGSSPAPSSKPPPPPDHRKVRRPPSLTENDALELRSAMLTDADLEAIRREIELED